MNLIITLDILSRLKTGTNNETIPIFPSIISKVVLTFRQSINEQKNYFNR